MPGSVMYSSDGRGNWWRTEWEPQCGAKVLFRGTCQGVKGHKKVHWCYGQDGSYEWSDNKNDSTEDGSAGSTPPGHKAYKAPEFMRRHLYLTRRKTKRVRDKTIIAKLEKDRTPERGASINRPV